MPVSWTLPPLSPKEIEAGARHVPPAAFPNWRAKSDPETIAMVDSPRDGLFFEVRWDSFWLPSWPPRPRKYADAELTVKAQFAMVPPMVPINSRIFVPSAPFEEGNPVYDLIFFEVERLGADFPEGMARAFGFELPHAAIAPSKAIPFWDYFSIEEFQDLDTSWTRIPPNYWEDVSSDYS